jgi:tetratricopeptide (TPR) repeat protein
MPPRAQQIALNEVEARLRASPDAPDLLFDRAALLDALGRDEARDAYLAVLAQAPDHFGALSNLGALLLKTGYRSAARTVYAEAVRAHPTQAAAHINLANLLAAAEAPDLARLHFQTALALAPESPEAHQGLAHLYASLGDEDAARPHRLAGFRDRAVMVRPYRGEGEAVRLLVLDSIQGGTVPISHHLDDRVFETSVLHVEVFPPDRPLPAHDRIFNAIGDADLCGPALAAAAHLLSRAKARSPINPPARVSQTGRVQNAERFSHVTGVVTPRMSILPRARLETPDAVGDLAEQGFSFPLLLRAPGFHAGQFFRRIERPQDLTQTVAELPGDALMAIEFLDARAADGKIRKYRAMMIGGRLYPLHAAVSHDWKIHYFSAEMADHPEHRAEDLAFLVDMAAVLGPRAMGALAAIRDTLGLDYAGADFSLTPQGEMILFEANATMVVNPPDPDPRWDYRRPHVQVVLDAIQGLLRGEAS